MSVVSNSSLRIAVLILLVAAPLTSTQVAAGEVRIGQVTSTASNGDSQVSGGVFSRLLGMYARAAKNAQNTQGANKRQ